MDYFLSHFFKLGLMLLLKLGYFLIELSFTLVDRLLLVGVYLFCSLVDLNELSFKKLYALFHFLFEGVFLVDLGLFLLLKDSF